MWIQNRGKRVTSVYMLMYEYLTFRKPLIQWKVTCLHQYNMVWWKQRRCIKVQWSKHVQKVNHMTIFSMHDFIILVGDWAFIFSWEIFGTILKDFKTGMWCVHLFLFSLKRYTFFCCSFCEALSSYIYSKLNYCRDM